MRTTLDLAHVHGSRWLKPALLGSALLGPAVLGPALLGALLAVSLCACAGDLRWPRIPTQRLPGPMPAKVEPLPPGISEAFPPGPEEVLVVRHADPVQLRPAGQLAAFPMAFYDKSRRVSTGSVVFTAAGGRSEVSWSDGSWAVMFGPVTAVVGSPSRGEPRLMLFEIERVDLSAAVRERYRMMGGSILSIESGPWVVERIRDDTIRIANQSKLPGELAFRRDVFLLDPGESIDVPLLGEDIAAQHFEGAPIQDAIEGRTIAGPDFELVLEGEVERLQDPRGVRLRSRGEHRIHGFGVSVILLDGEEVRFSGLEIESSPAVLTVVGSN